MTTGRDRRQGEAGRSVGLDAVRSAAILMVLLSHCGDMFASWFGARAPAYLSAAGFFGVELFFVLSGFLIGRLLIRIAAEKPDLRAWRIFMIRRWMRTLPLYFLVLAILCLVWPPYFWEPGHVHLWRALPWFLTLTQNLAWPMVENWFGVTWSLTVEEWFYLSFSAVLLAGVAWTGRWWFWVAASLFLILPPAARWILPPGTDWGEVTGKVVVYRLDSIVFGAVAALLEAGGSRLLRWPATLLAAGVTIVAFIWAGGLSSIPGMNQHIRDTFIFDLVSIGFALCLPAAAQPGSPGRVLTWVCAALGRQSYCIYLIHLPLLEMIGYYRTLYHYPALVAAVLSLGSIFGLSHVSYRWIERPLLARRPPQHGGAVLA